MTRQNKPVFRERRLKFDRNDLALYWGYVQGTDLRTLQATYQAELTDLRAVKSKVRAIAGNLAAAARQSGRADLSALFMRDPWAMKQPRHAAPTLAEFRSAVDPDDFYSEADLQEMWTDRFGHATPRPAEARRARLRVRIREGLAWMEDQFLARPEPTDRVAVWLPAVYARRLEAAGLHTLVQLVVHINAHGQKWHRQVRGIGQAKARVIEDWLKCHEQPGRLQLLPPAALTPRQLAKLDLDAASPSPVVTLERLQLPEGLDGADGRFRAPAEACTLNARNDLQAVEEWIFTKGSPHTKRAYRREAERLLLWCVLVLGKPMSSMTVEDCGRYRDFIRNPVPVDAWCAPRGTPRWSNAWRPFEGPLAGAAEHQALAILKSMAAWLREQNYLLVNPWRGLSSRSSQRPKIDKRRSLSQRQWRYVSAALDELGDKGAAPRLRFTMWLLYGTGLRLAEAVNARIKDLDTIGLSDGTEVLRLTVLGKGEKPRAMPLASALKQRLNDYLRSRGYGGVAEAPADAWLLANTKGEGGVRPGTLYRQVKEFFQSLARRLEREGDTESAAKLSRATTHWMRHTFGTHLATLTRDVVLTRDLLGHSTVATSSTYLDTDEIEQRNAVERLLQVD